MQLFMQLEKEVLAEPFDPFQPGLYPLPANHRLTKANYGGVLEMLIKVLDAITPDHQ